MADIPKRCWGSWTEGVGVGLLAGALVYATDLAFAKIESTTWIVEIALAIVLLFGGHWLRRLKGKSAGPYVQ